MSKFTSQYLMDQKILKRGRGGDRGGGRGGYLLAKTALHRIREAALAPRLKSR